MSLVSDLINRCDDHAWRLQAAEDRAFRASEAHVITMGKLHAALALLREARAELEGIWYSDYNKVPTDSTVHTIDAFLTAHEAP